MRFEELACEGANDAIGAFTGVDGKEWKLKKKASQRVFRVYRSAHHVEILENPQQVVQLRVGPFDGRLDGRGGSEVR
jgi:hypothetical protein